MTRFANDAFKSMRQFVNMPHKARTRDTFFNDSPYYYGLDEREWLNKTEDMIDRILDPREDNNQIANELITKWNMTPDEAGKMISEAKYRGSNNQVRLGIPHTGNTEMIGKLALDASGNPTTLLNSLDVQDTDLETMVGNMRNFIDVQMNYPRGGIQENQVIPMLNSLGRGVPGRAVRQMGGNETLKNLIDRATAMSNGGGNYDKLLQSRSAFNAGKIKENKIKDQLLVGSYDRDKVRNLVGRSTLGSYDPRAPMNLSVIDLNRLREPLRQMNRRELTQEGIELLPFDEGKIKVRLPMEFIDRYGRPSSEMLDPQVIDELNQMAP